LISVDLRREGRGPRSGETAGLASPKRSALASSYGNARASPTSPTPMPPPAGRPRQIEHPRLRRQRHGRRHRLRGQRPLELRLPHQRLDHERQRHLRRRRPRFRPRLRRVRRRRPERVRVQHHLPPLRPVLLLEVVHGLTRRLSGRPGREARRRRPPRCPAPRVIGSGKNPTSQCAGQPTRAPAPCASTSTARPPAIGPWNAGGY
jgi:hypothetical protein